MEVMGYSWDIHGNYGFFIDFRSSLVGTVGSCTMGYLVHQAPSSPFSPLSSAGDALCDGIHVGWGALQTPLQSQALL